MIFDWVAAEDFFRVYADESDESPKRIQMLFNLTTEVHVLAAARRGSVLGKREPIVTGAEDTNEIVDQARIGPERIE